MADPKARVREQFGRQAGAYARSQTHAADVDLAALIKHLPLTERDRVLDVATGTGFTALAIRPRVERVVGLDLTWEMLGEGKRRAGAHAGLDWIQGDVEALPFFDQMFSVVTCRRSAHHFSQLDQALSEMVRVLRVGGWLGIVDHANPDGTAGRQLMEDQERLRDPSHVRALTPGEWRAIVEEHRVTVQVAEVHERRVAFDEWVERAGVDAERQARLAAAFAQASPLAQEEIGYRGGARPSFVRRWFVLIGRR